LKVKKKLKKLKRISISNNSHKSVLHRKITFVVQNKYKMKQTNILKDLVYNDSKVAISVLFETETTKEIRIVFKAGQIMKKHQTPYPITVEMVEGNLDFGVNNEILKLEKGALLSLNGGVPHDLNAKTNCIVRLTLSKLDKVDRVKNVANS